MSAAYVARSHGSARHNAVDRLPSSLDNVHNPTLSTAIQQLLLLYSKATKNYVINTLSVYLNTDPRLIVSVRYQTLFLNPALIGTLASFSNSFDCKYPQ